VRWRLLSVALLFAAASTGIAWLSLQPILLSLMEGLRRAGAGGGASGPLARAQAQLPFLLAFDLLLITAIAFVLLFLVLGRPLERASAAVEKLGNMGGEDRLELGNDAGPLLSQLQGVLHRTAQALSTERATTHRQLEELRDLNLKLGEAQIGLVASERLVTVGKLAAGVAHEVGNPLSGILGYLSLVRSRAKSAPAELDDLVTRIEREVERIDQIVRSLLDLGRPPKGNPAPVELRRLVDSCAKLVAAGKDFEEVEVVLEVSPELLAFAEAGPLSQVMINLLMNAAQAMGGRGTVWVRGRSASGWAELEVTDSGPGIAAEVLPRLFEPFVTTKTAGKGTGLGLAVSLHLANGMGGTLKADNPPGGGARFTLALPLPPALPGSDDASPGGRGVTTR
jgi:two-component system NtrC family sensor kinase